MTKTRSPNYPSMSLPEAIEKARAVYSKDYQSEMPSTVVAEHMGYSGLNGASLTAISALKKYGLLEGRGDSVRISDAAQAVIEGLPEASGTMESLAFAPSLWGEIHQSFGEQVPSESNLRAFLLKRGFNPSKVAGIIRSYIETVEFVRAVSKEYTARQDYGGLMDPTNQQRMGKPSGMASFWPPDQEPGQAMVFPMGNDFVAKITFTGVITQKRLGKLIDFVNLAMDEYPKDLPSDSNRVRPEEEKPT